jgi:long-subunit fatty acid transport protein
MEVELMKQADRRFLMWSALALLILGSLQGAALAVTDEEIFRDFRFNLSNPGARSQALGGAFIAVSDDATAALANPAGLMLLARPEFFTEIRDTNADDAFNELDFGGGTTLLTGTRPQAVFSPSFFSYVQPGKRFAWGVSRVEISKASNAATSSVSFLFTDPTDPNIQQFLDQAGNGRIEAEQSVLNFSGAVKLHEKLSVGATVAVGFLDVQAGVTNQFTDPNGSVILYETAIDDHDTDVAFNVGLHWRPWSRLSFGAVYRGGYEFEVEETIFNDGFFQGRVAQFFGSPLMTTLNAPDSWGAGAAWRPLNALTISADWVHINYEDLLEGFESGLNVVLLGFRNAPFTIEDADEFHVGGEYVFTAGTIPWAVRAGAFSDHNSRIFLEGPLERIFPPRDTEIHYTVGTGVVVKERFQIDAAAAISEIVDEYILSTIFRF